MTFDYFYSSQADSYSFYRIPRVLITGEHFKTLSTDAKLLYSLLLDRMGLSLKNNWLDDEGRVYIYYTIEEIQEDLCCGHVKAGKLLAELDAKSGIGLIERIKQGQGKPTKIYVKWFASVHEDSPANSRHTKAVRQESLEMEAKTARSCTSRPTNDRSADFRKTDTNYIDNNNTDFSYTYPSIHQPEYGACMEKLKEQVDFPLLAESYPNDDPESILELICDVLCSASPTIRIGRESLPIGKVQDRFKRLRFEHVAYVLDSLRETTTRIINIKAYLLRALYDAPLTMGHFYAAAVRHDFA